MRFIVSAIVLVSVAAVIFGTFIMFNYIFNDPDTGIIEQLNTSANESMNTDQYNDYQDQIRKGKEAFGIDMVIIFLAAVLLFVVALFYRRRRRDTF